MTIKRLVLALPFLFLSWIAVLLLVMRFSDAAPGAVVILPSEAFMLALPEEVSILGISPVAITLSSDEPDFARRLYRAGAMLVLPAGLPGCLPLPNPV